MNRTPVQRYVWYRLALLASAPLFIGLAGALVLQRRGASNPVLSVHIRLDLGTLVFMLGLVVTVILLVTGAFWLWNRSHLQSALAEAQQEAAEARRRFVHRLDHELKNPVTAIRAQLAYLALGSRGGTSDQALFDMSQQLDRLARLLTDLRKLADLEKRAIEFLPVDIAQLLAEVVDAAQAHPNYHERQVRMLLPQAPWPLPAAAGDRDLLWLMFYNLLDNALKFTSTESIVEVRAFEDSQWLAAEVADSGPGIPEDDLPHVFEELYRGANARTCAGSGLGLPLVRTITARHGGNVVVRSRSGQGTVFTVRLPVIS